MTLALFAAAGRGARLVGRPRSSVAHFYVGSLTRTGRHVPIRGRAVCGAYTRRLSVLEFPVVLEHGAGDRRVCARCRARLSSPQAGRARQHQRSAAPGAPSPVPGAAAQAGVRRDDLVAAFGHLTARQLAAHARAAGTRDDIDLVGTVELIVIGAVAAHRPLPGYPPHVSLHDVVERCRRRLYLADPTEEEAARDAIVRARDADDVDRARRRRKADYEERRAELEARRAPHPRELDARRARAG